MGFFQQSHGYSRKNSLIEALRIEMKLALVLLGVFVALLEASPAPGPDRENFPWRCNSKTNEGCDDDHCCLLNMICSELREEGAICNIGCGCAKGLVCKKVNWLGIKKCVDDGGSGDFAFEL